MIESIKLGGNGGVNGGANAFPGLFVDAYQAAKASDESAMAELQQTIDSLQQIYDMLGGVTADISGEELQNEIYAIGREAGYENLRDFFKDIYQILLGQSQGPRLGSFFKLYGIEATMNLKYLLLLFHTCFFIDFLFLNIFPDFNNNLPAK